ncbi:unnamed protein product [Paramecium pentaurelia]|uniref:EML-like second beta-propeller domain-containing protein n=1 Tax=Paramecium pentaurelia TaxID=43138 RepID=A0A8S1WRA8_9CILI|nr:unnamed protein product [Paramecium pentaurelia]
MQGPFQEQEALADIFDQVKGVDQKIFGVILQIFRKEKVQDCLGHLSNNGIQIHLEQQIIQGKNLTKVENEQKLSVIRSDMKIIRDVLKKIKDHDFNKLDYSNEEYKESVKDLIIGIKYDIKIIKFLQFLVNLTSIDNTLIECGSNSLHILVQMKANLRNQNLKNIKIEDTSLVGAKLVLCNLRESQFNNANISLIYLYEALQFNCKLVNLRIHELNKLNGHTSSVKQICFSPDGNILASGSDDKSIRLWDVKTGQQKAQLYGHRYKVNSVCFSPDGNTLASGSNDNSIQQKKISKFVGYKLPVYSIRFSPNGNIIASCIWDETIRLWDVKTGLLKVQLDGHTDHVYSVYFSPDGNTLASGSDDNSIRLWDVKTGQQKAQLDGHDGCVNSVCFSPDGNKLASGSTDNSIRLWDLNTGQQKVQFIGHTGTVYSVYFSPDGKTLASGSDDNSIRLWDVKTGQQKAKLDGHTGTVYSVCFSPDGNKLASGSYDKSVCLWDVTTALEILFQDNSNNEILENGNISLLQNNPPMVNTNILESTIQK